MAKFIIQGLNEYTKMLEELGESETVRHMCGATIYSGADVVANEIRKGIESLPASESYTYGSEKKEVSVISEAQKEGLLDSFGISKMSYEGGYYNVKLGFDGYNSQKSKKYPNGQPNQMIARAINSGTSFRRKIPFIDSAVRKSRHKASKAMQKRFDEELKKKIGG